MWLKKIQACITNRDTPLISFENFHSCISQAAWSNRMLDQLPLAEIEQISYQVAISRRSRNSLESLERQSKLLFRYKKTETSIEKTQNGILTAAPKKCISSSGRAREVTPQGGRIYLDPSTLCAAMARSHQKHSSHQQTLEHERNINCALVVIGGFTIKTQQFTQMMIGVMIGELKRYFECQIKKCTLLSSNAEYQTTVLSSKLIDLSNQHNQDS